MIMMVKIAVSTIFRPAKIDRKTIAKMKFLICNILVFGVSSEYRARLHKFLFI